MVTHTHLYPLGSGGVRRNFHMVREAARQHDVRVLVLDPGHDAAGFDRACGSPAPRVTVVDTGYHGSRRILADGVYLATGREIGRRSAIVQRTIDALCRDHRPELIHLSSPLLRRYELPAGVPVVADAHNVEHDNLLRISRTTRSPVRRLFTGSLARRLREDETTQVRRCDGILSVSDRDRDMFRRLAPGTPVHTVPNGVDLSQFIPRGIEREPRSLVFAGVMNYPPNNEGVRRFLKEILPLVAAAVPDVRLTIVGRDPDHAVRRRASDRVRVTGYVDDVRPYLESAEVFIAPLYAGGGSRLKILEAMAMGTPVVSTSIGCEGLLVEPGEHLLVADTPEEFARAILLLFGDPVLRGVLAARGLELVRSGYGWDRIGDDLRQAYALTAGAAGPSSPARMDAGRRQEARS
jgi:glycosyltransferase involved in cell wall biosynthesis